MLTQERADMISKFLADNQERAEKLFEQEPAEALKALNAAGYDFTEEELKEYGEALKLAVTRGELKEDDLDSVSGGAVITVSVGVMIACGVGGFAAGYVCNKGWKW